MSTTPPPAQRTARFPFVSLIRGIAAILVVVFHLQIHIFEHLDIKPYSFTWWVFLGFFDLGKYAVASFFLISGFLIPATLRAPGATIRSFVTHRFFRLYPAYWFAIAFAVIVSVVLGTTSELEPTVVLWNLTMTQRFFGYPDFIGVFWTLQIELVFYAVCVVLAARGLLARHGLWKNVFLCCALLMAIARGVSGIGLPVALPIALALMFFADGLRMMPERRIGKSLLLETVLLAASLVPICLAGYGAEGPRYIVTYWAALATFVPCWQYADTVLEVNPYRRVAEFLGDISYSVYLLGTPLTWLAAGTVWTATGNRTATVVALVGTTVLLSWSVYQWIEAPCIRFGKRLDRRRLTYAKSVPAAVLD